MNATLARNLELYINAMGRKKEWIRLRLDLDKDAFESLLKGDTTHLLAFADLFEESVSYLLQEDFTPPENILDMIKRQRGEEKPPMSKLEFALSKLERVPDIVTHAQWTLQDIGENVPPSFAEEIIRLAREIETKSYALKEYANKKEAESYNS